METPMKPSILAENPNAPPQNLAFAENPEAPPPLELVPRGTGAATRHEAGRRYDMAASLLHRSGKNKIGKWTMMPIVMIQCQRCKSYVDLAYN